MAVTGHSRLGASSCKRWMSCPGSISLLSTLPERRSSVYAAEGTCAHGLCECFLINGLPVSPVGECCFLGEIREIDNFEITVNREMLEAAGLYAKTIFDDMVSHNLLAAPNKQIPSKQGVNTDYLFIEQQFTLKYDKDLGGTNDASVVVPNKKVIVYDFKYGAGVPVEVEHNEQLMFYALGAIENIQKKNPTLVEGMSSVELVIIQPRAPHSDGPIRRWECSISELYSFAEKMYKAVDIINNSDCTYLCSGSHCRWCDAKGICSEYRNRVNEGAQMTFAPVALEEPQILEPPKAQDLSIEQISRIMSLVPVVKGFIEDVESRAYELLNQGIEVPGFKLVQKRSNRKWIDEQLVIDTFGEQSWDKKVKSPAQLEKIIGKDKILDYTMTPEAGLTVVPESDKRQGVVPAQQAFDCLGFDLDI